MQKHAKYLKGFEMFSEYAKAWTSVQIMCRESIRKKPTKFHEIASKLLEKYLESMGRARGKYQEGIGKVMRKHW